MQFPILYPDQALIRLALRGSAAYQLNWFDAHLWAYAEHFGLDQLISEDFQHDRLYGSVRVVNPYLIALRDRAIGGLQVVAPPLATKRFPG